jgi:DNA repair ATPase RecN
LEKEIQMIYPNIVIQEGNGVVDLDKLSNDLNIMKNKLAETTEPGIDNNSINALIQTILEGTDNLKLNIKQQIIDVYGNMGSIRQSISQLPDTAPYNVSNLQSIKKRLNQMKEINEQLYYIKNYIQIIEDADKIYKSQLNDISNIIEINVAENIAKRTSRFSGPRITSSFKFL